MDHDEPYEDMLGMGINCYKNVLIPHASFIQYALAKPVEQYKGSSAPKI